MGSINLESNKLEMYEIGPCKDAFQIGFLIGQKFSKQIHNRLSTDLILQNQLLPFALLPDSQPLIHTLSETNKNKFPNYWNELKGIAQGSGVPFLNILLLNFRKEILPFIPKTENYPKEEDINDDCSSILVVSNTMAVAAHNEDANVALVGHTYLVKVALSNGTTFTAYTYAGELPSCAFGFNNHGVAFTLNSVPPCEEEIVVGAIGRNFVSRALLEASSIEDALARIYSSEASVGHSYNLIDTRSRRILNVETASRNRISVHEIGETPFFHANMYLHLQVKQASIPFDLQARASSLAKESKSDFLALLGDMSNDKYPIYMTGPLLYTLCTAVIDLDEKILTIIEGNPKEKQESYVFSLS
ncbi:hypothetical protein T459_30574 [Capsicum annuum]|uniref:Peptidase C45 hydrolase domain-containing protein n=1 Tax=Capsicum annuum TaxID=4072 RepID=A0A2G2Y8Y9_CAPAN|nr:putative BTB/POZ domain-containing protein POB1-like [Capsicum annuum]PHT66149.1 hypothetical protein T459_30574 [Capsicum annuum]